jgi:hypothetical protein
MRTSILLAFFCCPLLYFSQPNTEVFLFDLTTENNTFQLSNFKNISNNVGYDNQPSFLDNNTILFAGTRNNQTDIVKYNIGDDTKEWLSNTEGGEYSPIKIPNKNAVSAVRLELDGVQKFYGYDIKTGDYELLIDKIIIGYYIWFDKNIVVSSALENDYLSLYLSEVDKNKHTRIEEHIGRSLHHIPNSNLISYISKSNADWDIKSLNPESGEMNFITKTLAQTEDMCWLSDGSVLMAKDGILFRYHPKENSDWQEVFSLKSQGITNITRLAVSPDGKKIAVVGELQNLWPKKKETQLIDVLKTQETITIDGKANESIWSKTNWNPMDQRWLGQPFTSEDFEGRYKLCWSEDALYLLVEIKDDVLFDQYKDPLQLWWDDDCVEVFIDEDNSGGEHQYNHNAFAYHVALDGNVVDMSTEKTGKLYNSHVTSKNVTSGNTTIWELKISIFDDKYDDTNDAKNTTVKLHPNKKIGFAIAYCDNDSSIERENFIGSIPVEGENKNKGWIDANIFGTIQLKN